MTFTESILKIQYYQITKVLKHLKINFEPQEFCINNYNSYNFENSLVIGSLNNNIADIAELLILSNVFYTDENTGKKYSIEILIIPILEKNELYVIDNMPATNLFFHIKMENGQCKVLLIRSVKPIMLDGLKVLTEIEPDYSDLLIDYIMTGSSVTSLTHDKYKMYKFFKNHFLFPDHYLLKKSNISEQIRSFQQKNNEHIILKTVTGAGGYTVKEFTDTQQAAKYAERLIENNMEVILENYISHDTIMVNNEKYHYKLRLLVILQKDPVFLAAILICAKGDLPITDSYVSPYYRNDVYFNAIDYRKELNFDLNQLMTDSIAATKSLYDHVSDNTSSPVGLLGFDFIVNEKNYYFLEVNSGAVGGLDNLVEIKSNILSEIGQKLSNAYGYWLLNNYYKKLNTKKKNVITSLDHRIMDLFRLIYFKTKLTKEFPVSRQDLKLEIQNLLKEKDKIKKSGGIFNLFAEKIMEKLKKDDRKKVTK